MSRRGAFGGARHGGSFGDRSQLRDGPPPRRRGRRPNRGINRGVKRALWKAVAVPRLSVLIPARNAADTIESALRSTLRALPDDAEVLVLDDASSDRTPELVRGIGDRRVKLTVAPENLGVARALAQLLDLAEGDLVARMDADDVCLPGRFSGQLAAIERGADLVFSTFQVIGSRAPAPRAASTPRARGRPARPAPRQPLPALHRSRPPQRSRRRRRVPGLRRRGLRPLVAGRHRRRPHRPARPRRHPAAGQRPGRSPPTPDTATASPPTPPSPSPTGPSPASSGGSTTRRGFASCRFMRTRPLSPVGKGLLEPFIHRFVASLRDLGGARALVPDPARASGAGHPRRLTAAAAASRRRAGHARGEPDPDDRHRQVGHRDDARHQDAEQRPARRRGRRGAGGGTQRDDDEGDEQHRPDEPEAAQHQEEQAGGPVAAEPDARARTSRGRSATTARSRDRGPGS